MLEFETMEEKRLMTSHSEHHKVLALAVATVFIGTEGTRTRGDVIVTDKSAFTTAYGKYAQALKSNNASATTLVDLAKETYFQAKRQFGPLHRNTIMFQQNLAHAFMEAADFRYAAIHYTAVLKHHEAVTGDDAQEYFFVLLDIVNLLKSQTRYHDSLVSHIPRSFYSLSEVFDKLLLATECLVETMPESALLFREQALKACHSHPHLLPAKKLKNLASAHLNDAVRTHGRLSETAIEARFFLGNVYLDTKLYNKAVIEFETVLDALDEILEFTHPLALASHLRLVGIFETQGKSEFATRHCKAIGQMTVWKDNEQQNPLHRVLPSLQSTTNEEALQVSLSFDISKLGYVKNARVVDSSHAELNADILSAFQRWRFAPKYRFGIAMEAKGQQILLEYPWSK